MKRLNKMKKVEISELFNQEMTIPRYACLTPTYRDMYYFYLEKNIELTYHKKNLLKYLDKERDKFFSTDKPHKEKSELGELVSSYSFKAGVFGAILMMSMWYCQFAYEDIIIHETANVENTYGVISYLSTDVNNDSIKEIDTSMFEDINHYKDPGDDNYYYNTNLLYHFQDDLRVLDNISYMVAMDHLGIDVIEIDNTIYSKTGIVTEIHYTDYIGDVPVAGIISTSTIFNNNEEIEKYLSKKLHKTDFDQKAEIDFIVTYESKLLDDIPSVYKNKEDGSVTTKEPNKVLTKVMKSYL